jgi:hypothetical protein
VTKRSTTFWRKLHGWLTIFWAVMLPISILTGLKNSLPYLVGLSVYALMGTHFSAWQGSRAEESNEDV